MARLSADLTGKDARVPQLNNSFWVLLADADPDAPSWYAWSMVIPDANGGFTNEGFDSGSGDDSYTAHEVNDVQGLDGSYQKVEFAGYDESDQPVYNFTSADNGWFPAVLTCYGPRGKAIDPAFTDNRYWFIRAQVKSNPVGGSTSGSASAPPTHPVDASKHLVEFEKLPFGHPQYLHRACTNLFEDNCSTHYLRPDTPVTVFWLYDASGEKRYWILVADEGTCRSQPCDSSSSSSSSTSSSNSSSSQSASSQSSTNQSSSGSASTSGSGSGSGSAGSGSGSMGSGGSGSGGSMGSGGGSMGSGSNKSTAIVPASWSPTGYAALFIHEMPEVRFDDVIVKTVPQADGVIRIDPRYLAVCEPGSVQVCGCTVDAPVAVGASVHRHGVRLRFAPESKTKRVQVVIRLTGVRKGFADQRFPSRTQTQFEQNERFINSAYDA